MHPSGASRRGIANAYFLGCLKFESVAIHQARTHHPMRRPRVRAKACTHLENRLKYRDLDDPRFWKRLHVGPAATVDKTRVFRTCRLPIKRCVHTIGRKQGPINTDLNFAKSWSTSWA